MRMNFARKYRRVLSFVLSLALLLVTLPLGAIAEGASTVTGVITGEKVQVRSGPGTNHSALKHNGSKIYLNHASGSVPLVNSVTVYGDAVPSSGTDTYKWYKISFTYGGSSYEGYVASVYVSVQSSEEETPVIPTPPPVENLNFEEQLAAFPESYHAALRALHAAHPAWNFEAVNTELDWNYVQSLENRLGYSYTNAGILSYYSTAQGSYDWETDTYFVLEGSNWYQAAPALVAYYMDPRNFLNDTELFQFEKLAFSASTQTLDYITAMLRSTFMENGIIKDAAGNDVSYAQAFLNAAETHNVSAFHLITRCIQEVGWRGSACAHGTYSGYEGYYNFFNIGANTGARAGMEYAKNKGWDSPYKAIVGGAEFIGKNYIARGQNTPYFQKFNVVEKDKVGSHQYMTNIAAAYSEGKIQKNKYAELGFTETALTFRIPVYRNMPTAACQKPAAAGSPNNYLKSLSVEGYHLTPTFDFYDCLNNGTKEWTLIITGNVPSVRVNATAVSATAVVSGAVGNVSLQTGENKLVITCTAANGEARTFTLKIILNGEGSGETPPPSGGETPPPAPIPSGWNPPYRIQGSTLSGFKPGTDVSAVLSSLGLFGSAAATFTDEKGNAVSSGAVRTGLTLNYFDGTNTTAFQIILYGDVNGDSSLNGLDLLLMQKHFMEIHTYTKTESLAADLNKDGVTNGLDLLLMQKFFMEMINIEQ